jgi:beta-lactamase superfamily II metal-dependent hydrolase
MKYEFEMLSINCADAIILRFLTETNLEYVVLIDSGYKKDGKKIMEQINQYTTQKYIDLAICSHPDSDHIGGFFNIVGNMEIKEFWIHDPSKHVDMADVKRTISKGKLTKSLKCITESLDSSENLLQLIDTYEIPRAEPFAGKKHHVLPIEIVGPTEDYYEELLMKFRDINHLFDQEDYLEKAHSVDILTEALSDTLDAQDDLSNENSSSVITLMTIDSNKYLFTADATPDAQRRACEYADLSNLIFLDVPHHGSKYNLTSDLITHYSPNVAYISADGSRKYPSRAVVNALKKIGARVYCTATAGNIHRPGTMGQRPGYTYPATEM